MNLENEIKRLAKAGHSRQHVRELLGFSRGRFEAVLELIGPVQWPVIGRSVRHREHYARIKGTHQPALIENARRARLARNQPRMHCVRGVRGTITQLVDVFQAPVTASTVYRRIKSGAPLEHALFTPSATGKGRLPL